MKDNRKKEEIYIILQDYIANFICLKRVLLITIITAFICVLLAKSYYAYMILFAINIVIISANVIFNKYTVGFDSNLNRFFIEILDDRKVYLLAEDIGDKSEEFTKMMIDKLHNRFIVYTILIIDIIYLIILSIKSLI